MKSWAVAALALLSLVHGAHAAAPEIDATNLELEPVGSIPALGGLHGWQAVDDRRLIVWATPFDPYLVELAMPSHDLRFTHAIGVKAPGSRVYARFDSIEVAGLTYPISQIYKLDREQARKPLSW
jgi:hypothetical protein